MINILITGENSYIGTSFDNYMKKFKEDYTMETICVKGENWRDKDFSEFDVIYHVAGIAHQKETGSNRDFYYQVNCNLTKEIATKAKKSGIKQFIFLSSMSVYGVSSGKIDKSTIPNPTTSYGKSKLLAENYLKEIEDENFKIAIVRPPMVYGKNCKGNYVTLAKFVNKTPVFPKIKNKRSMIFIDNLSFTIKKIINENRQGIICPQNTEYICTSDLAKEIKINDGKIIYLSSLLGIGAKVFKKNKVIIKIFGNLYYDFVDIQNLPYDFKSSIELTEEKP